MRSRIFGSLLLLSMLTGCASQQVQRSPILYPNDAFTGRPRSQVDADIRECDFKADAVVPKKSTGTQVTDVVLAAAESAAVGSAAGAVGGVITQGSVGRATGAGAAIGGMLGAYGAIKELNKIDPKERNFIKACLEEKGYRVIGWESE